MNTSSDVITGVGLKDKPRKSRWPARMDLTQSLSGLVLGLFMWGHNNLAIGGSWPGNPDARLRII